MIARELKMLFFIKGWSNTFISDTNPNLAPVFYLFLLEKNLFTSLKSSKVDNGLQHDVYNKEVIKLIEIQPEVTQIIQFSIF